MAEETHLMNASNKTPLMIALVLIAALFVMFAALFLGFGSGAMSGSAMHGTAMGSGMMGYGTVGGFSWMWIPILLTASLIGLVGWMILARR
jgi:hypothetical protein